jgi:hypothetical protein
MSALPYVRSDLYARVKADCGGNVNAIYADLHQRAARYLALPDVMERTRQALDARGPMDGTAHRALSSGPFDRHFTRATQNRLRKISFWLTDKEHVSRWDILSLALVWSFDPAAVPPPPPGSRLWLPMGWNDHADKTASSPVAPAGDPPAAEEKPSAPEAPGLVDHLHAGARKAPRLKR